MEKPCPVWPNETQPASLISVVSGLAKFQRFAEKNSKNHILAVGDLKTWHGNIFRAVAPLAYYAGNFRADDAWRPCLRQDVTVGGASCAPFAAVPGMMDALSQEMHELTVKTDEYIAKRPTPADRARAAIQLAAVYAGKFIRIHPFLNGNGRMSRCIANYHFSRYDYPSPYYDPYARPGPDYAHANAACMAGDFSPLYRYLISVLAAK
jgi:fido (protein-threonine AMPylation protein)